MTNVIRFTVNSSEPGYFDGVRDEMLANRSVGRVFIAEHGRYYIATPAMNRIDQLNELAMKMVKQGKIALAQEPNSTIKGE